MLAKGLLNSFVRFGDLTVIDAKGKSHRFEGGDGSRATIRLNDPSLHWRLLFNPYLAAGEGYMDGGLTIEDGTLYDFLDICLANACTIESRGFYRLIDLAIRARAKFRHYNPISRAKGKVSHHYDLKSELFDLFLCDDRQYSCAYFADPDEDIETAQTRKKLHLAAKLLLGPGQRVLDIGSGWGGLGMFLAGIADVSVDGATLSTEPHRVSNERAASAGLAEKASFHLKDYRLLDGKYDRIVSVGMLEHVGPKHYPEFYSKVAELLTDDGVAVIHCIGKFHSPYPQNPWMEKYIFPGAYTPTLAEQMPHIEQAKLLVADVEILRIHYADTLKRWREAFNDNMDEVRAMYDDRFCRMWDFYLTGCELAFRYDSLMVFQIQLSKKIDTVPLTRDYISEFEHQYWGRLTDRPRLREAGE